MALTIRIKNIVVSIGDSVRISQNVQEGEKTRVQHFLGVVVAIKGGHEERTVTVRRLATGGIGVERTFPIDLPSLTSVSVQKTADVRRSKLYYLRERGGKAALHLKERRDGTSVQKAQRGVRRGRRARVS